MVVADAMCTKEKAFIVSGESVEDFPIIGNY